jgi:polyisoprenoid-binding protein YceI
MNKRISYYAIHIFVVFVFLSGFALPTSAGDNYSLDPVHTSVSFRIKHLGVTNVHGRFNDVSGMLRFDEASPENFSIVVQVETASVYTANTTRDNDLRSSNFFDAKKYPLIEFKSTSVEKVDAETYEVRGDLNLHGVSRPLKVAAMMTGAGQDPWGNYRIGFETAFKIKRSDFGMANALDIAGDEVRLIVNVEGIRK